LPSLIAQEFIRFAHVFPSRNDLQIPMHMQPADILSRERDDVIHMPLLAGFLDALFGILIYLADSLAVGPLGHGVAPASSAASFGRMVDSVRFDFAVTLYADDLNNPDSIFLESSEHAIRAHLVKVADNVYMLPKREYFLVDLSSVVNQFPPFARKAEQAEK
jgi:hypothetical protein